MIVSQEIMILIRVLFAHLIADFVLQTDNWVKKKFLKGYKSKEFYFHILIVGLITYLFIGKWNQFLLPAIIMAAHLVIDLWKISKESNLKYYLIDQMLHIISILTVWYLLINTNRNIPDQILLILNNPAYLLIAAGYIIIFFPLDYLIGFSTERWRIEITNTNTEGLKKAGRWIGKLERVLILTFIFINHFEAIGFLIAAKSILRYGELKDQNSRKEAEYILIGTLLSFTLTIITGIFIKLIIS